MSPQKRARNSKDWRQRAQTLFLGAAGGRAIAESIVFFKKAREAVLANKARFADILIPLSDTELLTIYREAPESIGQLEASKELYKEETERLTRSIADLSQEEARLVKAHDEQRIIEFNLQAELFGYHNLAPPPQPVLKSGSHRKARTTPKAVPGSTGGHRSFKPKKPSAEFARTLSLFEQLDHEDEAAATNAFTQLLAHFNRHSRRLHDVFSTREDTGISSQAVLEKAVSGILNQIEILDREVDVLRESVRSLAEHERELLSEVNGLRPSVAALLKQNAFLSDQAEKERRKRGLSNPSPPQPQPAPQPPRRSQPAPASRPSQATSQAYRPVPQTPTSPPSAVSPSRKGVRRFALAASVTVAAVAGVLFYSKRETSPPQEPRTIRVLALYTQKRVTPVTEPRGDAPAASPSIGKGMRVLASPDVLHGAAGSMWRRYYDASGKPLGYIEHHRLSDALPPEPPLDEQAVQVLYAKEALSLGPITIAGKQLHRHALPGDALLVKRITSQSGVRMARVVYSMNNLEYGTVPLSKLTVYPFTGKAADSLGRVWTKSCSEFNGYYSPSPGAEILHTHKSNTRVLLAERFIDGFQDRWVAYSEPKSGKYIGYIRDKEFGCPVDDPRPARSRSATLGQARKVFTSSYNHFEVD